MAKYLDSNGLSHFMTLVKAAFVSVVSYNSTTKKIQVTKGGTTSDVVTLATVATSGSYNDLSDKPTIVDNDTKNTAGSSNDNAKLYIVGAKSQSSTGVQTYSNSNAYEQNGGLYASTFNDYTLGAACEAGIDSAVTSGSVSTNLPTTAAVADYVDSAVTVASSGALTYKGVVTTLTDITSLSYKQGWYWVVGSNPNITIDGVTCEAGDMIISKQDKTASADNDLDVVQSNIEALTTVEITALWTAA